MLNNLIKLLKNSKSDYYNYKVSCVLVCKDSKEFFGVNVETSSPAAGICAERNALFSAISAGYKKEDFKEMHILVDSKKHAKPCFVCRQALADYVLDDVEIFLYSIDGFCEKVVLRDLIPHKFDKEDL